MGLDNGIILKVANEKDYKAAYNTFRHEDWYDENEFEVAYWRKCWGVRAAILSLYPKSNEEPYSYPVTSANIKDIIKEFKYFLRKKHWDDDAGSIWEWDDKYTRRNQRRNLWNLYKLKWWLRWHPNDTAYFYDSY